MTDPPPRPRRWPRLPWPARPALWIPSVFCLLAFAVWGIPAALGHPILRNSNLIQNFPLRVLVGSDLAHGHLPLWDPYIWSGTPLLAGFNAGAAYPLTWLFTVLPRDLAWVINQGSGQAIGACGLLVLSRCRGRSWPAAALAGLAYGFGGFLVAQNLHIDLVLAAGWLPWCLVGLDRLANRPADRSPAPWVALLAAAAALLVLTGSPEPILDGSLLIGAFAVFLAWTTPERRRQILVGLVAAAGVGALASAAQWLPGALFQVHSQRAGASYGYFTSGSLGWGSLLAGVDPALFGTSHPSVVGYVGPNGLSSIPEISWYLGAGVLVAACALLARVHRRSAAGRERWFWYGVVVVGLILALGGSTPLAHVEVLIPVYNGQRMLVRNLLEVDIALAVIFADWLDVVLSGHRVAGRAERRLVLVPVTVIGVLAVALAADGPGLLDLLGAPYPVSRAATWPIFALTLVALALAACWAWLAWRPRRWARRRLSFVMAGLCVVDLGFFGMIATPPPLPNATSKHDAALATALADRVQSTAARSPTASPSRVAFFDPVITHADTMDLLGQPDLTILRGVTSVNGNGALVSGAYENLTGAQAQLHILPEALAGPLADHLDIGLLVAAQTGFLQPVQYQNGQALPSTPTAYPATAPPPPTTLLLGTGTRTWYTGGQVRIDSLEVPVTGIPSTPHTTPRVRIGVLVASPGPGNGSDVRWLTPSFVGPARRGPGRGQITVHLTTPVDAVGVVARAQSGHPASVGQAILGTPGTGAFRLAGPLVDTVTPPQWHPSSTLGPFGVYQNSSPSGAGFLVTGPTGRPSPGSVTLTGSTADGTVTFRVTSTLPALLVRSEVSASGWVATVRHVPGGRAGPRSQNGRSTGESTATKAATSTKAATTWGVLQAIRVPAGSSVVTFTYRPRADDVALAASVLGWLLILALVLWNVVRRVSPGRRVGRGPLAPGSPAPGSPAPTPAHATPIPTTPEFRGLPPIEPWNGAVKEKIPPSAATNQ